MTWFGVFVDLVSLPSVGKLKAIVDPGRQPGLL